MTDGIKKTIRLLAHSKNRSAAKLLESALSSSSDPVRRTAGRELVFAQNGRGIPELIRRFDPTDPDMVDLFRENRTKIVPFLRSAVVSKDWELSRNALRIANTQQFFELISLLLNIILEHQEPNPDRLSSLESVIMRLIDKFVMALDAETPAERSTPTSLHATVLPEVLRTVSKGLKNHTRSGPVLILRAYLAFYPFISNDMQGINEVLRTSASPAYLSIYHLLQNDQEPVVYRFLYYCMDHPNPPPVAVSIFTKRNDPQFLAFVFKEIDKQLSDVFLENFEQIPQPTWLEQLRDLLHQLDDHAQLGLVKLICHLRRPEGIVQSWLREVFRSGSTMGRTDAFKALIRYSGKQVDDLIWQACGDKDPDIQVLALTTLRERNIDQAASRILQFAASPHQQVRETVRSLLPQFRLSGFLQNFDKMSGEQRRHGFQLIRLIDPHVLDELAHTLITGPAADKLKVLLCIDQADLIAQLEESICNVLLKGEDPALRIKAAELLASGKRDLSRSTLVQALHRDPDTGVRQAAKASLEKRPAPWSPKNEV